MIVCRRRGDYRRSFKLSAAFNVSQHDRVPLELFRTRSAAARCDGVATTGWYWEVNHLGDLAGRVVPFFDRFPVLGEKAQDYRLWREAVMLLSADVVSDRDYRQILALRERMNRGGKRRYRMDGILRDYTTSLAP